MSTLLRIVEDVATAPDRTYKQPRWLLVPWSVAIPALAAVLVLVVGWLAS